VVHFLQLTLFLSRVPYSGRQKIARAEKNGRLFSGILSNDPKLITNFSKHTFSFFMSVLLVSEIKIYELSILRYFLYD
jgi:hypothetical protein